MKISLLKAAAWGREPSVTAAPPSPAGPETPAAAEAAPVALTPEQERAAGKREVRAALKAARIRLTQGSVWLWQWHTASLRRWCAAGRRSDLTGLGAELGVWARGGTLAVIGYGSWRLVEARPAVLWAVAGVWLLAACHAEHPEIRAAKRKARAEAKAAEEAAEPNDDRDAELNDGDDDEDGGEDDQDDEEEPTIIDLIRAEIGADSGVHLRDLYPAMRAGVPALSQAPDEALREVLTAHHIRVRRSIRARGVAGRSGVHRSDLPPLLSPKGVSNPLSTPLSTHGDAGQSRGAESRGEPRRAAESGTESTVRVVQDPDNPVRWHVIPS